MFRFRSVRLLIAAVVTEFGGALVRPHDLELFTEHADGAVSAEICRLQRVGFEVRAELRIDDDRPWVQLTRGQADALDLAAGGRVWVRGPR